MDQQTEADNVWDKLLDAALELDAALVPIYGTTIAYTDNAALIERFHSAVLEAPHVRSG